MRMVSLFLLLLVAGCGYHSPGHSDEWVGGEARLVYVQLFVNSTTEPYLENYMTDALIAELSRSRSLELTENSDLAELRLVGEVKDFTSNALAYGSTDQITQYRASMTVAVRLLRGNSSEIVWQQTMHGTQDYPATRNKNLQLEGQTLAANQVSQRLAEDILARMLNSF